MKSARPPSGGRKCDKLNREHPIRGTIFRADPNLFETGHDFRGPRRQVFVDAVAFVVPKSVNKDAGFTPANLPRQDSRFRLSSRVLKPIQLTRIEDQKENFKEMPTTRRYKVGLVQMSMGPDPEANLAAALEHVRQAAHRHANIVCLPELFKAQYFCQREDTRLFDLAEAIPGPTTARLAEVAREARVAIVASLFERRAPGLYHNTAVTLNSDGAIVSVYRKMHIPDDPLYYEKYYFTPGDLGFKAVDTAAGRIGTLVCWDQWYPEGARLTALQGAEVLFYPTAIGWHPAEKEEYGAAQYDAWQTIQRAHAIANGVYVAGVNRVGHETGDVMGNRVEGPGLEFWGGSFLADPFGRIIAKGSHTSEEILIGEIDLALIEDTRRNWPFLRDRRIDAYGPITSRFLDPVHAWAPDGDAK